MNEQPSPSCTSGQFRIFTKMGKSMGLSVPLFFYWMPVLKSLWIILGCLLHWHCQYYLRYISLHKHIASTTYYNQLGIKKVPLTPRVRLNWFEGAYTRPNEVRIPKENKLLNFEKNIRKLLLRKRFLHWKLPPRKNVTLSSDDYLSEGG